MSKFSNKEKIGLLKRGLERRVVGSKGAIEEQLKNIETIENSRKELTSRIKLYKDDEITVKMLKAQLSEFDRQYNGEVVRFKMAIEEIKMSKPQTKRVLEMINAIQDENSNAVNSRELLLGLIDLFFAQIIQDWSELEESFKKEVHEKGTNNNNSEKPN